MFKLTVLHKTQCPAASCSGSMSITANRSQPQRLSVSCGVSQEDRQHMQHALELAGRGLGKTHPNPAVGCVILKDGKVIGEGFHPQAGKPHAEVYALRAAGQAAAGATAYVTLEPCNHFGRTPPCSRALVAAGVKRVVIGVGDPNPLVGGAGIKTLQAAGIEVELVGGAEEESAYSLNSEFIKTLQAAGIEVELVGGAEEESAYSLNSEFMERMKAQGQ